MIRSLTRHIFNLRSESHVRWTTNCRDCRYDVANFIVRCIDDVLKDQVIECHEINKFKERWNLTSELRTSKKFKLTSLRWRSSRRGDVGEFEIRTEIIVIRISQVFILNVYHRHVTTWLLTDVSVAIVVINSLSNSGTIIRKINTFVDKCRESSRIISVIGKCPDERQRIRQEYFDQVLLVIVNSRSRGKTKAFIRLISKWRNRKYDEKWREESWWSYPIDVDAEDLRTTKYDTRSFESYRRRRHWHQGHHTRKMIFCLCYSVFSRERDPTSPREPCDRDNVDVVDDVRAAHRTLLRLICSVDHRYLHYIVRGIEDDVQNTNQTHLDIVVKYHEREKNSKESQGVENDTSTVRPARLDQEVSLGRWEIFWEVRDEEEVTYENVWNHLDVVTTTQSRKGGFGFVPSTEYE